MSQLQAFEEIRKRLTEEQKATNSKRQKEDLAVRLKREGEDEAVRSKRQEEDGALRLKRLEEDRIFDRKTTQLLLETHTGDERAKPSTKDDNNASAQKHDGAQSKNDNALPAAVNPLKFRETTTQHVRDHQLILWLNNKVHKPGYYLLECCWCDFSERLSEVVEPINALFSHARYKHGNKSKGPDVLAQYGITAHQTLLEYCAIQVTDADEEWFLTYEANRKKVNAIADEVDAASVESSQHGSHKAQKPASVSKEGGEGSKKLVEGRKRGRDDFEDDMPADTSSDELRFIAPAKPKTSSAAPKSIPRNITPNHNTPANDSDSDDPFVTLGEDEEDGEEEYVPPPKKRNIFGSY